MTDLTEFKRLRSARLFTILISFVAIGAIMLAVYAFQQKKKADELIGLSKQKELDALLAQQRAQREILKADSSWEEQVKQTQIANETSRKYLIESQIADSARFVAEENTNKAREGEQQLRRQIQITDSIDNVAKQNGIKAYNSIKQRDSITVIAISAKGKAAELSDLIRSRDLAHEAVVLLNENKIDSSKNIAQQAYDLNKTNDGPHQNNDVYNALYLNWAKSINDRNQSGIHVLPIHCITGLPNKNVVFTADESGMIHESVITNNGLQRTASYAVKEEVRGLAVSPDESKLIASTASGDGFVLNISSPGITMQSSFKFPGMGKAIKFSSASVFFVLSNKGISKYDLLHLNEPTFLNRDGINAFTLSKSGKFYIATSNLVKTYSDWDNLIKDLPSQVLQFDAKVTSMALDDNEQFFAAGTYNGSVSIRDLKSDDVVWKGTPHKSSVNDLKFSRIGNGLLQLASAGADQTIELISVDGLEKNSNEEIITLRGHTKWIYALYYTHDGQWLFSTGADNKVIAWRPAMEDLYQSLYNK